MHAGLNTNRYRTMGFNRGFSVVELLVVVCVLSILGAILFPVFSKVKESARVSECLSNMRQMGIGLHSYIDDYNGRFPAAVSYGSPEYWTPKNRHTIQELLARYVQNGVETTLKQGRTGYAKTVFVCPSDKGGMPEAESKFGITASLPVWKSTGCSYQYYASIQEDWDHSGVAVPWTGISPLVANADGKTRMGAAVSDIPRPTRKAVLGDMYYWHLGDRTPDNCLSYGNTLFADGHASRVRGAVHLECRLEQLRPWHTGTEITSEE